MYLYMPMGSFTVSTESYNITTDGLESPTRIECLDELLGTQLEVTETHSTVKSYSPEPVMMPVVAEK